MGKQFLFLSTLLVLLTGCTPILAQPLMYSADAIHGSVVDAETGQPLPDVAVVAFWWLSPTIWGHEQYHKRLHIIEVVTDAAGQYVVPAWGPKPCPPGSILDNSNPQLSFFKNGYTPTWRNNAPLQTEQPPASAHVTSKWDGAVIKLEQFQGTIEKERRWLSSYEGSLRRGGGDEWWDWKNYPHTMLELIEAVQRLKASGLKPGYGPAFPSDAAFEKTVREFLRGQKK
jgi:hypothetical protein